MIAGKRRLPVDTLSIFSCFNNGSGTPTSGSSVRYQKIIFGYRSEEIIFNLSGAANLGLPKTSEIASLGFVVLLDDRNLFCAL